MARDLAPEVMSDRRLQDLIRFYSILNRLEKTIGGARGLADWHSLVRKDILSHCYRPLNVPRSEALVRCPRLASRFKVRIVALPRSCYAIACTFPCDLPSEDRK